MRAARHAHVVGAARVGRRHVHARAVAVQPALAALDARLDEVGYQCSALDSSAGVKALNTLVTGLPFCHRRAAPLGG